MAARGFPYPDLQSFLAALEAAGELRRVSVPVDPTLEISEVVTRTVRAGGPALLFERPTRGEMPVVVNLFGTEKRMAMALGVDSLDEVGDRIGEMIKPELPVGWSGIREGLGKVLQLKSLPPRKVKTAPMARRNAKRPPHSPMAARWMSAGICARTDPASGPAA